jgi:glutamate-1-semialdehyde 2,1-aminomutase
MGLPPDLETVMARGQGSRVWDVDGREYIDYLMGSGPMVIGHAHPEVVAAVQRCVADGVQFYQLTEPLLALAETIVQAVPCAQRVKFVNTGTEATFLALRLARAFTSKPKVLKMEGGFHGTNDYAVWGTRHRRAFEPPYAECDSLGVPGVLREQVLIAPFNDIETTGEMVRRHKDELAAVIVEPLQRNIPPKKEFLQGLRQVTRECGVLLVFDEVVTGFRLAWGGAQEVWGVVPDLVCLGKAIGGGHPTGAVAGPAELFQTVTPEAVAEGHFVIASGTFSGNPLSATAGLATLGVLRRPGSYDRLNANGKRLGDGLKRLSHILEIPAYVCQTGSVVDILFTDREVRTYRDTWSADSAKGTKFRHEMIRRGIWSPPGSKMYVSLVHSNEEIDRTLEVAEAAMRALR